jgi:hypothetical protein
MKCCEVLTCIALALTKKIHRLIGAAIQAKSRTAIARSKLDEWEKQLLK